MSLPRSLIKRRVIQAMTLVIAIFAFPLVVDEFWPIGAKFLPPHFLILIVLLSILEAFLVWKPEWLMALLFPGHKGIPDFVKSNSKSKNQRIGAVISLAFSSFLLIHWVWSIL